MFAYFWTIRSYPTVQRDYEPAEKAVRLSSLVARFRTRPVLSQKCAILDVLRQLANSNPDGEGEIGIGTEFASHSQHANGINRPNMVNGTSKSHQLNSTAGAIRTHSSSDMMIRNDGRPTEAALLHDLPFTLQGLSTTHLPFTDTSTLKLPPALPLPIISLLHTLAEPSLLYRSLSNFVQSADEGLVGQSLRAAISNELRSYLGLIATLEGEIRRALPSISSQEPRGRIGKVGVTLKRCVVWTREATLGLRLMSLMVEEAKRNSSQDESHVLC